MKEGEKIEPDEILEGHIKGTKDNKFNEEEYGYMDDEVTDNKKKDKKRKKDKKKKFKEQNVEYDDGEENNEKEEEEEKEPEKLIEDQPDEIFSGVIPGIKAKKSEIEDAKINDNYPLDYYVDEDENLYEHKFDTINYKDQETNMNGLINGQQKNDDNNDYNTSHNYAGENKKFQFKVSLSQIFVDESKNYEDHYYFKDF